MSLTMCGMLLELIQGDVARVSEADERKMALQISCCFALSTCSRALSAAQGLGIIGCMD